MRVEPALGRTGTLVESRFRSSVVDSQAYFLTCMRYIELNPVRAGMVEHPRRYFWSSFRENETGAPRAPLVAHPVFTALGATAKARGQAYRRLVDAGVGPEDLAAIRMSLQQCKALGTDEFCARMSHLIERDVAPARPGRPKKGDGAEKVPVP